MTPKSNQVRRNRHFLKALIIGGLTLFLMIPGFMLQDLVEERQERQKEASTEVGEKWGQKQVVIGPVLSIPYKDYEKNDSVTVEVIRFAHFLPNDLRVDGRLMPEKRYRSFYEIVVYNSNIHIEGQFAPIDAKVLSIAPDQLILKDAFIAMGISDLRGIEEQITMRWNQDSTTFNSGIATNDVLSTGISALVPVAVDGKTPYLFSLDLTLKGSESLFFAPIGKEPQLKLASNWPTPSFDGAFLPDDRQVTDQGFSAFWKVLHLNRNYPQNWLGSRNDITETTFGVNLFLPTDHYKKTLRTTKYAFILIAMTFLVFFFIEILNKKSVHPFQYLLIGFALCIFYALLLAFSEHINFNIAYWMAAPMTIGLIGVYAWNILGDRRLGGLVSGILLLLYGFIFTIVQLKDYALLIGSLGLFMTLALVMYLSRKIDWYNLDADAADMPPSV